MSNPKPANPLARERARELRREASIPERVLWSRLRDRRLFEFKFRRQHPIGPYFTDFFCEAAKLVVELDGQANHRGERWSYDRARDAWMIGEGYEVLRFSVSEFSKNEDGVLMRITEVCRRRAAELEVPRVKKNPHPNSLPEGEGAGKAPRSRRRKSPLPPSPPGRGPG